MNLFPSRGGWPFLGPPNCDFELNTNSPQAQGLVAWWPIIGNARGIAPVRDRYGEHHLVFPGGASNPAWSAREQIGFAPHYDGTDDYLSIPDYSIFTGLAAFTFNVWFNPDTITAGALGHGGTGAANQILGMRSDRDALEVQIGESDEAYVWMRNLADSEFSVETSTSPLAAKETALITVRYDGARLAIHINGIFVVDDAVTGVTDTMTSGYIGSHEGERNYFDGVIGDTRLYNRALSPAEIWAMYAPQTRWELCRPLVPHFPGVTLAAGGVDVSLDTLALTGAAQGMTVSPGAVNVALDALGLTAAAQSLTVQAVTTIALDALALVGAARGLTVVPGEATTALDLLTLTGVAQGLTVSSGAVSVALDALGLTATAQGLTVSPGAVTVVLDALGLSASAETITISSGVIVALNALALSIQAESLGVSPGAVAVELASLGLTGAAQGLDILPGAVTIALDALTLASAAGPLTVSTGIRVALDALALTGTVLGTTVEPGSVGVSLDALNLTAAILALSIAAGADMIDVDVSDALVWGAAVADALLYHVEVSDTSRE